jgi:hypothetical protein
MSADVMFAASIERTEPALVADVRQPTFIMRPHCGVDVVRTVESERDCTKAL